MDVNRQHTPTSRRTFLSMGAASLPLAGMALSMPTPLEQARDWVKAGQIGTVRAIYMVRPYRGASTPRYEAEEYLRMLQKTLSLPAPLRRNCFEDQQSCMLLLTYPDNLELTVHLSPAPPPGPEITLHGTMGRIEIDHSSVRRCPAH